MSQTFNQTLEEEVLKRLDKAIQETRVSIGAGTLPDYAAYKYHCGIIQGYENAKGLLQEALTDLQRR